MVSTFPPEGGGVSTYTKNLIESFNPSSFDIVVLAQRSQRPYEHVKGASVIGCWDEGFLYPFQIFKALCRYKPSIVHVQHEYFIFGRTLSSAMFPVLTFFRRFLGIKFIVTLHGVVNPVEIRDPELGSIGNENLQGLPTSICLMGLLLITRLITDNSDKIILMNNTHFNVLIHQYHCSPKKIALIPHGVPQYKAIDQNLAKKKLGFDGKRVILYFGYLTKYKGIDILLKAFQEIDNQDSILVIGGAAHPRLKDDPKYKKFWATITEQISKDKRIKLVGFIPEEILSEYISASDIVVFPYVASFSTGGPMNITLGHYKPIIASKVSSFSDSLPKDAVFKTGSASDLAKLLYHALSDKHLLSELANSTRHVAEERSWKNVAKSTSDLYHIILKKQKS